MTIHLIYGPPGCGKTTHLASVAQATSQQRGGKEILIASLTRAAAAEIGARDTGVPADHCGTLHSICFHALGRPTIAEGKVKDWNTAHPSWVITPQSGTEDEVEQSQEIAYSSRFDVTGDDLLAVTQLLRARMIDEEDWSAAHPWGYEARRFYEAWCEWKDDCGHMDFTDLISEAIRRHPTVPKGASVLLFDEAQDYSKLEARLCNQWAEEARHTIFVGDPDQSLYIWRGADPLMFMNMEVAQDKRRVLGQSYRVPGAICEYATRWVRQIHEREDVTYLPTEVDGLVRQTELRWPHASDVLPFVRKVEELGETFMILTSCNYMLDPMVAMLRANGVRFCNPYRRKNGRWNPIRMGGKKRISAFDRLRAFVNMVNSNKPEDIHLWLEPLKAGILTTGAKTRAKNLEVGLDYQSLRDLFVREEDFINAMDVNLDWYVDNCLDSKAKAFVYPRQVLKRYASSGRSDDMVAALEAMPNVIVGSCHSVKGGEADNVLLFPDISYAAEQSIQNEGFDPVCRQFYVGMTRAKKRLFLGRRMLGKRHHAVEWL